MKKLKIDKSKFTEVNKYELQTSISRIKKTMKFFKFKKMKTLLLFLLPLLTFAQPKKEPYPFVSMDSLVSRAFRIHYIECEFMKKDLFDTRTLFQKQSEISDHLRSIIDLQKRESVVLANSLDIVTDENEVLKTALNQNEKALVKETRRKKANKWFYFGLGAISTAGAVYLLR